MFLQGCATDVAATDRSESAGEPRAAAQVAKATGESFSRLVLEADGPVVVQYHAAWCNHCRALESDLRELAAEHTGAVTVVSVSIDDDEDLAERHGIESVPTLHVYVSGERVGAIVGVRERAVLEGLFDSLAAGDARRLGEELRRIGPAEPGTACAAREPSPGNGDAATCAVPAS